MKRLADFVFSIILIIALSPVIICISLVIKLTSKGPVIFKQRRIGKHKAEFNIYKFRTMYIDAPRNMPTHMLENPEKFITPIGRILRKTSLDELPQLFNILKGEMSFVGPRPALYNQYDLIEMRDKACVNNVSPGITGWAQVNGRDELPIPIKVEFDKYYVQNQSLFLDIKIIFITVFNVILGKGVIEGNTRSLSKEETKI